MRKFSFKIAAALIMCFCAALCANASWYWPFDTDPDSTNKPPRLHKLMEKANEYIELAEDEALDGNGDKSIEYYREALKELDRVELENPERAATAEFAPLRNKRATCTGAIDAIRFAQVSANERAVSVSNTTELERKWRKKHGLQTPADEDFERKEAAKTNKVETVAATAPAVTNKPAAVATQGVAATNKVADALKAPVVKAPVPKSDGTLEADIKLALAHIKNKDYGRADVLMEKVLVRYPKSLNAMIVRAAAQTGSGNKYAARRTLESAMRAHPKSYIPYYNLAFLTLQTGGGIAVARDYYELGRMVGGPRNAELEKKLK